MFSIATLRKLALVVFEPPRPDSDESSSRGMTVSKSTRGKWLRAITKRFNKLDRVKCEQVGGTDFDPIKRVWRNYSAILFTVSSAEAIPSKRARSSGSIQTFLVTLDCRLVLQGSTQGSTHRRPSFHSNWVPGDPRVGLWLLECPSVGDEPELAVPVNDLAQIEHFIELVKARQDRRKLQTTRKLKITILKQHAFVAKLSDLARTHQFCFRLGYGVRDVTLSLCFDVNPHKDGAAFFHLAFPQGKFDQVLERVQTIIHSLQLLAARGIAFQSINRYSKQLQGEWIETIRQKALRKESL